ncbi:TonB-dependent receptor plug domain protein [Bacteroidales bacterium KA00344]|nr:TonB-dependent receptor plug domain protein [Bacteroidales bacterium KA00344]
MMKQKKFTVSHRALTLLCGLAFAAVSFAQQVVVKGHVKDATGEPIIGATIRANGQEGGEVTDIDGNFTLNVPAGTIISVSYIGFEEVKVTASSELVITMQEEHKSLNEVVVIGYGAVKKSDLTGSVTALKPDSKNKGLVVNAQDMIGGKIAGVNVTSNNGAPGAGATIRVRGGSSLNASNDPLIVIDGVPMDNNGVKGLSNPLSLVNPQDIESFNILKDASATAIYGSRGSNGVIIITTKKGRKGQKLSISYNGSATVSMKRKTIDVMNGDEYREFVKKLYEGNSRYDEAVGALGKANTDWQNEIYQTAFSQDHGVTVTGSAGATLPYRVSLGYTGQEGILKTSDFKRYTAAVNLSPSLFDNHLNINLNLKGMYADTKYANTGAIGAAVMMDPTKPVYSTEDKYKNFGGYYEWTMPGTSLNDPTWPLTYNDQATANPVAMLHLHNESAKSKDFVGNIDLDYKVHGFEDLRFHATAGADIATGKQVLDESPAYPSRERVYYGNHGWEKIDKQSYTMSGYVQYYHDFNDKAMNHFDIMLGSEYQRFTKSTHNFYYGYYPETNNDKKLAGTIYKPKGKDYDGDGTIDPYYDPTENRLLSFFGRANWSLMDSRYMLTATFRADGSTRFNWLKPYPNQQWGYFPSFAFAWRIKDENKFKDIEWLSNLKLRLGYGQTGQQEGIDDFSYYTSYTMNAGPDSYYPLSGDGTMARPAAVNHSLTWETTTTYNIGLDWGIFNQRLTGTVDWYYRKTTDLLNTVYVPAGANFKNTLRSNIGDMKNTGVEASFHWLALNTKDWNWTLDYNFTYNQNSITKLTGGKDKGYFVPTGGVSAGVGVNAQAHAVGHPASSFYVFQQVYDKNGMPLEGVVVDRNADGQITDADKYFYKSPAAPVTMGFASRLEYKNWDFGFSLRASIGNYVYNDGMAGKSNLNVSEIYSSHNYLSNRPQYVLPYKWQTYETTSTLSDRWVQNASFLKCDNITLGYSFNNLFKGANWQGISGRLYGAVNNVFTITKYEGIDPEVFGGIDNNLYPRPFSATVGLSLNF